MARRQDYIERKMELPIAANNRWEHFDHESDIGIRGIGPTLGQAFEQAALALTAILIPPQNISPRARIRISCQAPNRELLFIDWLNALIYEMAIRRMVFSRFKVAMTGQRLNAAAWGDSVTNVPYHPAAEVKAATYAELKVIPAENNTWLAQCIIDV